MQKYAWIAILLCLLGGIKTPATAQPSRSMLRLQSTVRSGMLRFSILSGRIALVQCRTNNMNSSSIRGSIQESIRIHGGNGQYSVSYQFTAPTEKFTLEINNNQQLELRWSPQGDSPNPPIMFLQEPQENLILTVGTEPHAKKYAAKTLWHLILGYPKETRKYLLPYLDLLQPSWKLTKTAAGLESELLQKAQTIRHYNRQQWKRWVAGLGDESFAKRQAADRALRTCDPTVLHYLQQLNFQRLDAEQQFRVQRIVRALSSRIDEDSPQQMASWLAGDPTIWLTLAARPDVSIRRTAVKQLEALLEEPVLIDPEADPATQKDRIKQLRQRLQESP